MKYLKLYGFISLILTVSCKISTEKNDNLEFKINKALEKYMQENLNDPASYQYVETKIDTLLNSFDLSEDGKLLIDTLNKYYLIANTELIPGPDTRRYNEAKERYLKKFKEYGVSQIGWKIYHKYRAKNAMGALILNEFTIYADNDIKSLKKDVWFEEPVKLFK